MAKFTNEQKLEALKEWLKENNIEYIENHKSNFGVTIDVKIPSLMIAVFLSDGDKEKEQTIYNARNDKWSQFGTFTGKGGWKLHYVYKPFFIRESETKKFVLEKISNCCFERMVELQKRFEKKNNKK